MKPAYRDFSVAPGAEKRTDVAKKKTIPELQAMKAKDEKIVMVTAYDATFTRILDQAGVDCVLVGDSLSMVIQGNPDTLSVTLDEMIYHGRIVRRGISKAHLVVDLPFGSYQESPEQAVRSASRLMKEGGAESVKLEGGLPMVPSVRRLSEVGIPAMGHIGLTPQSIHAFGGFKVQGRSAEAAAILKESALALEDAGAWAIVLEGIPSALAREISLSLRIPTIGIGAGAACDGQVLVIYDLLGMDNSFNPKFAKKYAKLADTINEAVGSFIGEVRSGQFPAAEHSYS